MNESGLNQTKLTDENMELNGKPPMGPMSMDMQMTFKHELPLNLIFQEIELHTLKDLVVACLLLFLLGALYEAIKRVRIGLNGPDCNAFLCCACNNTKSDLFSTKYKHEIDIEMECSSSMISSANSKRTDEIPEITPKRKKEIHPYLKHFVQTSLHAVQLFISYVIMLAVMTYNPFIVSSIIAGCTFAYFLLQWPSRSRKSSIHRPMKVMEETDCH